MKPTEKTIKFEFTPEELNRIWQVYHQWRFIDKHPITDLDCEILDKIEWYIRGPKPKNHNPAPFVYTSNPPQFQCMDCGKTYFTSTTEANCEGKKDE